MVTSIEEREKGSGKMSECLFCKSAANQSSRNDGEFTVVHCQRCGHFEITGTAKSLFSSMSVDTATISGWIQEQNSVGTKPSFDSNNIHILKTIAKPPLKVRVERYLLTVARKNPVLGTDFNPFEEYLIGVSYSSAQKELKVLVDFLENKGFLSRRRDALYRLKPEGYFEADELRSRRAKSSQCFVAMWFGEELTSIYDNAIEPAVRNAGYEPIRIDRKDDVVKIDDEILSEIRRSAFIIADFTAHRGGVYFEAGFAMGLGIPIVWTCRENDIQNLHFDIRQYNCLGWKNEEDFSVNLQKRIEGFLGRGPMG